MDQNAIVQSLLAQALEFIKQQDYTKAIDIYDLLLARDPKNVHIKYCLASIYSELYKSGIAICLLEDVVEAMPNHSQAWNNLGIAYKNSAQWEKAKNAYDKALELDYSATGLVNLSGLYINNNTPEEALRIALKGLKLNPHSPQLKNHRALALLEMGKFKEGFEAYEARFGLPGWHARKYKGPMWDGKPVKTLLVHGEQGLGDEILFAGSMGRAAELCDNIIFECAERLVPVFERSLGIRCFPTEQAVHASGVEYDAWVPVGSLFHLVGWERKAPYIKTGYTYPKGDRFRIGLSWRGGTIQTHEHLRNFPLEQWMPLAKVDGAEVISVQYGPAAGMANALGIKHDQEWIDDFDKMLAMIKSCDLIITVCNTACHQAGSQGVPCWVLTPTKTSWQFQLSGDDMPFYESVRLFRQAPGEEWPSVVERIRLELTNIGIGAPAL